METTTYLIILGALLAASEALSLIPVVKSNGIFQIVYQIIKYMTGKKA